MRTQIVQKIIGTQIMMNKFEELLILITKIMVYEPNYLWNHSNWYKTKPGPLIGLANSNSRRRKEE